MIFNFFDFETTGIGPGSGICEFGVVLWDSVTNRVFRSASMIIWDPSYVWQKKAIDKHGITPEFAAAVGSPQDKAFRQFQVYAKSAHVLAAYNGKVFDFPVWEDWAKANNDTIPQTLRFDPMVDIIWPPDYSRKLMYVCAEEGFLNPFPHMGISDCMSMLVLVQKKQREGLLGGILEYAKMPEIWVEGICSYEDRERVKSNGYHWLPWPLDQVQDPFKKVQKKWIKKIKEGFLDQEAQLGTEIGFEVGRLS